MKQSMLPIMLMVMLLLAGNVHAQVETADDLTETGIALYWENDFEGAIFQLNQALEINPRDVAALHYRCAIHRVYGNVMEALADCTFALQIDQNSGEAHSSYARLLAVLATLPADMEAALAEADLGVELAPESWLTHFNRGAVLSANEAYSEALDEYDEAIRLGMEHPHVFFNAGTVASFTLWDFQRGLRYWNPGLELYPDDPLMLFYRGSTIMNMGEFEVALEDLILAAELDPTMPSPHINMGYIYSVLGDTEKAQAAFIGWLERLAPERIERAPLQIDNTVRLQMTWGNAYKMAFSTESNSSISIYATNTSGNVDPLIYVFDEDRELIAYNDDAFITVDDNPQNAALLNLTLPTTTTGSYTLVITHAGGGYDGTIDVVIVEGE